MTKRRGKTWLAKWLKRPGKTPRADAVVKKAEADHHLIVFGKINSK